MDAKERIHPAAVELKEMECCALKWAIANGKHDDFIKDSIIKAQKIEPKYNWSILVESFAHTSNIAFIPRPICRDFYLNLALNEKSRLEKVPGDCLFPCGHYKAQHIKALGRICILMIYPQANN